MSNATSVAPGGVVLDWTAGRTGPPEPCVFGDGPAICRSLARLIREHTPRKAAAR